MPGKTFQRGSVKRATKKNKKVFNNGTVCWKKEVKKEKNLSKYHPEREKSSPGHV